MNDADGEPDWARHNTRGLAFATAQAWPHAAQAFTEASAALSRATGGDVAAHEALALVLGNLAQACFRSDRLDEAITHAQRGCALRAALAGEDAISVARARSDLAVLLASAGRLDESAQLLARAAGAIERSGGDEDPRLTVVLENLGRVALAKGDPSSAEPQLLRLHALLAAHGMPTDGAERLLARVASGRAEGMVGTTATESEADGWARDDVFPLAAGRAAYDDRTPSNPPAPTQNLTSAAQGPGAEDEEWEDQPLRDAVRLTDTLLRSTPSGIPVVRPEPQAVDPWTSTDGLVEALSDDAVEERPTKLAEAPTTEASEARTAEPPREDEVAPSTVEPDRAGAASRAPDVVELDVGQLELVDTAEHRVPAEAARPGPPAPPAAPQRDGMAADVVGPNAAAPSPAPPATGAPHPASPAAGRPTGLGFDVEYGIPVEPELLPPSPPLTQAPAGTPVAESRAPHAETERREPVDAPRPIPVVMPGGPGAGSGAPGAGRHTVLGLDAVPAGTGSPEAPRRPEPQRKAVRVPTAPSRSNRALTVGGLIAASLAAAAGWYFFRGGM